MFVDIDIIVHATEDMDKILNNLKTLLKLKRYKVERRDLTGHYKNPVIFLRLRIRSSDAEEFVENLFRRLNSLDKNYLILNIDEYIEKKRFYLRIEKNWICKGEVRLATRDPIKIVIHNIDKKRVLSYIYEEEE